METNKTSQEIMPIERRVKSFEDLHPAFVFSPSIVFNYHQALESSEQKVKELEKIAEVTEKGTAGLLDRIKELEEENKRLKGLLGQAFRDAYQYGWYRMNKSYENFKRENNIDQ